MGSVRVTAWPRPDPQDRDAVKDPDAVADIERLLRHMMVSNVRGSRV